MIDYKKLFISVVFSQLAGIIGSVFTISKIPSWYEALNKPLLNPPSFVFGPVWTALYLLIGVSLYLVWKKGSEGLKIKTAISVFLVQWALNASWSIVFFGLENPALALVNIILMWVFIVWTIILFRKISKTASYLLVPYLIWVSFASYLNYSIWILN